MLPETPPSTPEAALRLLVRLAQSSAMIQLPIEERSIWDAWLLDIKDHASLDLGPVLKAQRCGRCGVPGHNARTCRAVRCSRCKQMGHNKASCSFEGPTR